MKRSKLVAAVAALLVTAPYGTQARVWGATGPKRLLNLQRIQKQMVLERQRWSKLPVVFNGNPYAKIHDVSVSNLRVNGQNPATMALGDTATIEFSFDPGESIAYVHLLLDLDEDGAVSPADREIESGQAFVDNSDLDEDPAVGSFRVSFPSLPVFPAVASYILSLETEAGWTICPVRVAEPASNTSISGLVTDPAQTAGLVVFAVFGPEDQGQEENGLVIATFTDSSGAFTIPVPDYLAGDTAMVGAFDFANVAPGYVASVPVPVFVAGHVTGVTLTLLPANAWVRATVVDQFGAPVPGAPVFVESEGPGSEGVTDSLGVAVIEAFAGQRVWIGLNPDALWPEYSGADGLDTTLVAGDTLDARFVVYQNDAFIEGTVYLDGQPKPGIRIHAWSDVTYSHGWSDIDGHFRIPVYSQVPLGYWIDPDWDYVPEGYIAQRPDYPVQAGATGIRIDLIRASAHIQGYVTDARTGLPIEHADVWAQSDSFGRGTQTDPNGFYSIPVTNGFYTVHCWAEGYFSAEDTVTVSGADVQLDFQLEPFVAGAIAGVVTDESGAPLAGVYVAAETDSGQWRYEETTTGQDGSYLLGELPPGKYRVWAWGDFWTRTFYPDTLEYSGALPVSVAPGDTTRSIDFQLRPGGAIRGRVTDAATGEPLQDCQVHADNLELPWIMWGTQTGPNGEYVLGGLPPGVYVVSAECPWKGYLWQAYQNKPSWELFDSVRVNVQQYTDGIDFQLVWGAGISGHVLDSLMLMPIEGARVVAETVDGAAFSEAYTDANGMYFFQGIEPGEYRVYASAPGYGKQWYNRQSSVDSAAVVFAEAGLWQRSIDFWLGPGTGVSEKRPNALPTRFALYEAYPNPFNPETTIRFDLPKNCRANLAIYDPLGRRVAVLLNREMPPGRHTVHWDASNEKGHPVGSGVYLIVLEAAGKRFVTKVTLLR